MSNILLNSTAKITFVLVDTDNTEVAGLGTAFVLQVSKNGGAFGASAGTKAEIGSGWYSYTFTAAETNTAGPLAIKITHASTVQQNLLYEVVGSDWSAVPDYATVSELKAYLGVTGSGDDDLLTSLLSRAQKWIDDYTRREFTCAADSARYLEVGKDTDGDWAYLPADLCQITSVATNADDGAGGTALTVNTDYVPQPRSTTPYYALKMLANSSYSWDYTTDPELGVLITGRWAYSTTPPQDIIHACIRLAAYMYRQKDASTYDVTALPDAGVMMIPQGMPKDVKLILDQYVKAAL